MGRSRGGSPLSASSPLRRAGGAFAAARSRRRSGTDGLVPVLHVHPVLSSPLSVFQCSLLSPCCSLSVGSAPPPGPAPSSHVVLLLSHPVFCCDVVELGTYGKLKYYHSMTEEGKDDRLLALRRRHHSSFHPFFRLHGHGLSVCLSFCSPTGRVAVVTPSFLLRSHLSVCSSSQCLWRLRLFLREEAGVPGCSRRLPDLLLWVTHPPAGCVSGG